MSEEKLTISEDICRVFMLQDESGYSSKQIDEMLQKVEEESKDQAKE